LFRCADIGIAIKLPTISDSPATKRASEKLPVAVWTAPKK
jgi:hypothetical protein